MSQSYLERSRSAHARVVKNNAISECTSEESEKSEKSPAEPILTGGALEDAVFAKLAAVPDVIHEEISDLLWWSGEPERTADELRAAGLTDTFEGVCRWVLTASPLEVPRAMMRAGAYPEKYRFAAGYTAEGPINGVKP